MDINLNIPTTENQDQKITRYLIRINKHRSSLGLDVYPTINDFTDQLIRDQVQTWIVNDFDFEWIRNRIHEVDDEILDEVVKLLKE
jgi:hypothetical protein